jgi:hypothetical protein
VRRLLLYLDPFAGFKSIAAERGAVEYNRRHRGALLPYARRWAMIGLACGGLMELAAMAARVDPILCVPILGLALGFSAAVCMVLLSLAVYVVLGLEN